MRLRPLVTLACYGGAVGWLTWPLAARLATHLPRPKFICDFDLPQMIWALSWTAHALATAPGRLAEANVYHPTPHALLYADAGAGALPYFAPLYWATGNPVLAANVLFLGGIALTATALHRLVARWTGLGSAGVVAAAALLATPWVLRTWIPAAPNYAVLFLLPAIVGVAAAGTRPGLLAVLLVLHGAANPYYAAAALASVGLLAVVRLASPRTRAAGARGLAATAAAALALLVLYAPYAWVRSVDPGLAERVTWKADRLLPRLVPMALPGDLFADPRKPTAVPWPLLALVGAGLAVRARRRTPPPDGVRTAWRHGLWWLAVGLGLSLMPVVELGGVTVRVPGLATLDALPLVATLREPYRIGVGALVGAAVLAGVAFAECVRWVEARVAVGRPAALRAVAAGAVVLASAAVAYRGPDAAAAARLAPYPLAAAAVAEPTIAAALDAAPGPVLVLPLDGPPVARFAVHARAMLASVGHWWPLLNGYGGFVPAGFAERMQLAARLPHAGALAELRRTTGLAWVLVRGAEPSASRAAWATLAAHGGGPGLRLAARAGDDLLFAVTLP